MRIYKKSKGIIIVTVLENPKKVIGWQKANAVTKATLFHSLAFVVRKSANEKGS